MYRLTVCAVAILILLAGRVDAEGDSDEEALAAQYGGEEMIRIATGRSKPLHLAPAVATVITAKDIAAMGATDLDEVLETVPGLHVSPGIFMNVPRYFIRGITSQTNPQTLVLIDGVPINGHFSGSRSNVWAGMPVQAISRIEVMRGPGSALYGADAFAGVVNIITKTSELDGSTVGVGGGSYSTRTAFVQAGAKTESGGYGISLEWLRTDGPDEIIDADHQTSWDNLAVALGIPAPAVSLAPGSLDMRRDLLELHSYWQNGPFELRFGLQDRDKVGTGQGIAEALQPSGAFASRRYLLDARYALPELAENWSAEAEASYFWADQRVVERDVLFPPGAFFGAYPQGFIGEPEYEEENRRLDLRSAYHGFADQLLSLGLGWQSGGIPVVRETKNFDGSFAPLPGGLTDVTEDPSLVYLPEKSRQSRYLYLQDEWTLLRDLELTFGLRRDQYSDFGATTNPRFALVWAASYDWTLKFLYGEAFRAPVFTELYARNNPVTTGNPNLKPETIKTTELAANWQATPDWRFDLSLFRYDAEDSITVVATIAQNQGNRHGTGAELEAQFKPEGDWRWLAHVNYQNSVDEETGESPGLAPTWEAWQRLEWQAFDNWQLAAQLNVVSERERVAGDPRPALDGYEQLDLSLRWQTPAKGLSVAVRIGNATDADIREPTPGPGGPPFYFITIPNDYPMPSRTWWLSLSYGW